MTTEYPCTEFALRKVISYDKGSSGADDTTNILFTPGEWRDVTPIPPGEGKVTIRFKASDFVTPVIIHCHILYHEDEGMMMQATISALLLPGVV